MVIGFIVMSYQFVKIEAGFLTVARGRCHESTKLKTCDNKVVLLVDAE
jgi:hypothetical protein